jgi:hypothetical protein
MSVRKSIIIEFNDNKSFNVMHNTLQKIPYFNIMFQSHFLESNQDKIFINHTSLGFDYILHFLDYEEHLYLYIDNDNEYHDIRMQCDYFCYEKLKEMIERRYFQQDFIDKLYFDL